MHFVVTAIQSGHLASSMGNWIRILGLNLAISTFPRGVFVREGSLSAGLKRPDLKVLAVGAST